MNKIKMRRLILFMVTFFFCSISYSSNAAEYSESYTANSSIPDGGSKLLYIDTSNDISAENRVTRIDVSATLHSSGPHAALGQASARFDIDSNPDNGEVFFIAGDLIGSGEKAISKTFYSLFDGFEHQIKNLLSNHFSCL